MGSLLLLLSRNDSEESSTGWAFGGTNKLKTESMRIADLRFRTPKKQKTEGPNFQYSDVAD